MASDNSAEYAAKTTGEAFPPFDATTFTSQLFWLIISFALLYILMSRIILPRVGGMIEQRKSRIATDLDEAGRLNAEADQALAEMEKRVASARADARSKADETRTAIKARIAAQTAEKSAELDAKLTEAEARINDMKAKAMDNVSDIASTTAVALVGHLGGSASEADASKAVAKVRENA